MSLYAPSNTSLYKKSAASYAHDCVTELFKADLGQHKAYLEECIEACSCCQRNPEAYGNYAYRVEDDAEYTGYECPLCYCFNIFSESVLGIECTLKSGFTRVQRLTTFKGGYLILDKHNGHQIWLGGKYPDKVPKGSPLKAVALAGHAARAALLDYVASMDDNSVCVITDVGIRRDNILPNLAVSSKGLLRLSTAEGLLEVECEHWPKLKDYWVGLDRKVQDEFAATLNAIASGRKQYTDDSVRALFSAYQGVAIKLRDYLPPRAEARYFTVQALSAI